MIIFSFTINRTLPLSSLVWVIAVALVFGLAVNTGVSFGTILPYAGVALIPAIFGLVLWPFARHEWAQMLIIFSWIALAILACFAIAFLPMAILFLCAPAAAALFEREKVIEAMVLSALFAGIVYYAGWFGFAPEPIANPSQTSWAGLSGVLATIAFLIGALYFSANSKHKSDDPDQDAKVEFAEIYPGAAVKFSPDGALLMATDGAFSLLGIAEKRFDGVNITSLFPSTGSHNEVIKAYEQVRDTNTPVSLAYVSKDGQAQQLQLNIVPHLDGGIYIFAEDHTDTLDQLNELQSAQRHAEKNAAEKTLFFAGVSHELRTPLNAIIGFSDMMRSRLFGPLPGKYAEYADLIHDSGQHMLDLIGDVLDLSKVEAGKYELQYDEFDAADVIRSSVKMLRPAADAAELTLDVEVEVNSDLIVQADRRAVRQMLLNLLSNAIKFTPKGGRVLARAKTVEGTLNLSVEDTGVGMPASALKTIGEPFVQTANARMVAQRGSGLGLALVKDLVELHKGRFSMSSQPDIGTTVDLYLPTRKPAD